MANYSAQPVAIVTGSATGIGAACAVRLSHNGYNVVLNYTQSRDEAEKTAAACTGGETLLCAADISDDEACRALVESANEKWGRLDVLVNNAGMTRFAGARDLDGLSKQDFARIFEVNVTGHYQMTRASVPLLRKSDVASIVNMSSHSGMSGIGSSMAYAASKGALNTLTLALARSLAPDIRVNAICPGFVDTRWMSRKLQGEELDTFMQRVASISPLKRMVHAEDVAEAACWFALGGQAITGQLLVIDGGTHLSVGDPI
jgi:3-oxoacyl-[acyl-carrier protein] reductase